MDQINRESLEKGIRSLVAEILELDEAKISLNAKFVEELGMDSMMALEILAAMEKKYNIQIPEEKLGKIRDLKEVVDLASDYLKL